jgi:hypothetical protein
MDLLIKSTEENVLHYICMLVQQSQHRKTRNRYSRVWGGAGERGKGRIMDCASVGDARLRLTPGVMRCAR